MYDVVGGRRRACTNWTEANLIVPIMCIIYLRDISCKEIYYTKPLFKLITIMFPIDIDFSRLKEMLTYNPQGPDDIQQWYLPLAVRRLHDSIHLVAA